MMIPCALNFRMERGSHYGEPAITTLLKSNHAFIMTTELSDFRVTVGTITSHEDREPAPRSRKEPFLFDLIGCLFLILFFVGVFWAFKVCLEMCLPLITYEITEQVRAARGY
jgi:hypothetical protein